MDRVNSGAGRAESGQGNQSSDRLRVLIADDVRETRRGTRLMLTLIPDAEVVAIAHNGRQAVEMARKSDPDIALVDVNMPEMNGIQAIQAMMENKPDMTCIVISAERDSQTLQAAMAAGARNYLIKPFTAEQLVSAFDRARQMIKAAGSRQQINQQYMRMQAERDSFLRELGNEYVRARRLDDKALSVFEELAQKRDCETRFLVALATIYLLQRRWGALRVVATRLEKRAANASPE